MGNSFHCRSRTASNMTHELRLGNTIVNESEDFSVENLARDVADEQNDPLAGLQLKV